MEKIILTNVTGANNLSSMNDNFAKLQTFINDKSLSRDTEGETNQMMVQLDMNGQPIINLPKATETGMPITFEQLGNVEALAVEITTNLAESERHLNDAEHAVAIAEGLLSQTQELFDGATGEIATQKNEALAAINQTTQESRTLIATEGAALLTQVQDTASSAVAQIDALTTTISADLNEKYDTVVQKASEVTADRDFVALEVAKLDGKVEAAASSAATAAAKALEAGNSATASAASAALSAGEAANASNSASASASSAVAAAGSATGAAGSATNAGNAKTAAEVARDRAIQAAEDAESAAGGGVSRFNGRTGVVLPVAGDYTKAMVGLSDVDNTSDLNKPVSAATQTELNKKLSVDGGGTYAFNISGNAATATRATSAATADTAATATTATTANTANTATTATNATNATNATTATQAGKWTTPRAILGFTVDGTANVGAGKAFLAYSGDPTVALRSAAPGVYSGRNVSDITFGANSYDDYLAYGETGTGSRYIQKLSGYVKDTTAWAPDKARMTAWPRSFGNLYTNADWSTYWDSLSSTAAPVTLTSAETNAFQWSRLVSATGRTVMLPECIWEHRGLMRMRGTRPNLWFSQTDGAAAHSTFEIAHAAGVTYFVGMSNRTETPTNQFPLLIQWADNRIVANVVPNTSDRRNKTNIEYKTSKDDFLSKVKRLKVAEFDVRPINGTVEYHELGFIAQEFMEEFPVLVEEINVPMSEDTRLAMHYDRVGVIAIKAIQELSAQVDVLKAELAALKGK